MGWRERLRQVVLAGGTMAMSGCTGCCNANPDPCCSAPKSAACAAWNACYTDGGRIEWVPDPDAGAVEACVRPGDDLAVAAPPDLASAPDLENQD